jgi:hypothetical protein
MSDDRPRRSFKIGQRVRPTVYAISQFPTLKGKRGTIVGYSQKFYTHRLIKWDHRATADSYHPAFFNYARGT